MAGNISELTSAFGMAPRLLLPWTRTEMLRSFQVATADNEQSVDYRCLGVRNLAACAVKSELILFEEQSASPRTKWERRSFTICS